MTESRGPFHHLSGSRLPGKTRPVVECWRCAEDRRRLVQVSIVFEGKYVGPALVCLSCLGSVPHPDPDPLTLDEVA